MTDEQPPIVTIAEVRETLQDLDRSLLGDDSASHILNALGQLDNAILSASSDELAQMARAAGDDGEDLNDDGEEEVVDLSETYGEAEPEAKPTETAPVLNSDGSGAVPADVYIGAETWGKITAHAIYNVESGKDPELAYWDAVHEYVTTVPNLIVNGEVRGPEDIDELPLAGQEEC